MRLLDPELLVALEKGRQKERSTEQWLLLLQKQELIHQMELEKWHEMLGMATELLRKVIDSSSIIPPYNKCIKLFHAVQTYCNNQPCENRRV